MSNTDTLSKRSEYATVVVAVFIFILTFIVYSPALKNDFVNWDDDIYVYENADNLSLNFQSLSWMLTSFHAGNWHPFTWLSHAIDYFFWGLDPLGHHLASIILHGLNGLLVFFLTISLTVKAKEVNGILSSHKTKPLISTQSLIVAGVTALLFGFHPMQVESVAWISQRKNLLCSFFFMLSILSYLLYTSLVLKKHQWIWFIVSLFMFVFALMSKPMAVTLPVILLLLDIYPLKRLSLHHANGRKQLSALMEKIPFFSLSIASSIITIMAQHSGGAIRSIEYFQLNTRLLNALRSLVFYLEKIIVPVKMVPFYLFPVNINLLNLPYLVSALLVLVITCFCFWMVRRGNHLFFIVWSYYIITLIPVLGIIQVGDQAAADRYMYLPSLSIFLLIGIGTAWGWRKISLSRFKTELRVLIFVCVCTATCLLSYLTINQIKIWKDSIILWSYVIPFFPDRAQSAHFNLAHAYNEKGMLDKALAEYKRSLVLDPNNAKAHTNLGVLYAKKGLLSEAISEYKQALDLDPILALAHANLGIIYAQQGKYNSAIAHYKQALTINPGYSNAHNYLGLVYFQQEKYKEATSSYKQAIILNPNYAEAHNNLSVVYYYTGNYQSAIRHCDRAVALGAPVNPKLLEMLKPYR